MTTEEREVMELALATLESYEKSAYIKQSHPKRWANGNKAITTIKAALEARKALMSVSDGAQPEPVKIAHKHEWFRTGEMKIGQMRCISCGAWGQEETPQRTWVGLTDEEMKKVWYAMQNIMGWYSFQEIAKAIEAKLKEKNT